MTPFHGPCPLSALVCVCHFPLSQGLGNLQINKPATVEELIANVDRDVKAALEKSSDGDSSKPVRTSNRNFNRLMSNPECHDYVVFMAANSGIRVQRPSHGCDC